MTRPVGVTIIAICCFLVALYGAVNGIRLIARGGFMFTFSDAGETGGLAELGATLILDLIIFPALYALAGWCLWKRRNWGRWLTIFLAANGTAFRLLVWLLTSHHKASDYIATTMTFAFYGVIVWYLLKADVKAAFSAHA